MFGFFKSTYEATPKAFEGGILTFLVMKKPGLGKNIKLRLLFNAEDEIVDSTVSCSVASVEVDPEGGYMCTGVLNLSKKELTYLSDRFMYAGLPGACRRRTNRYTYGARVLSRRLPNFRAVTSDVNLEGFCIVADGPMEPGIYFNVQLDLESVGEGELTVQVVSVWSTSEADDRGSYKIGVTIPTQHRQIHEAWARLYDYVTALEGGSVMQKTMGGAPPAPSAKQEAAPAPSRGRTGAPPPPPQGYSAAAPPPPQGYGAGAPSAPAGPPAQPAVPGFQTPAAGGGLQPPGGIPSFQAPPSGVPGAPTFGTSQPSMAQGPTFSSGFGNQEAGPAAEVQRLRLPKGQLGGAPPPQAPRQQQPTANPHQGRGISLPPTQQPSFGLQQPSSGFAPSPPGGFSPPSNTGFSQPQSPGGFAPPPTPGGGGFAPPPAPGGFAPPPAPGGFAPPSPPGGGFAPPPAPGGFTPPPAPGGFTPPPSPGGGFAPPPAPGGFTPPPSPGGGFAPPPAPGGAPGFAPPPPPQGYQQQQQQQQRAYRPPPPPPAGYNPQGGGGFTPPPPPG